MLQRFRFLAARILPLALIIFSSGCVRRMESKDPAASHNAERADSKQSAPIDSFESFWKTFQSSLASNDREKLADLTDFSLFDPPYVGLNDFNTRESFIRNLETVFPEGAIQLITNTPAAALEITKLDFSGSKKRGYTLSWSNGVSSEGQLSITYYFTRTKVGIRLVRVRFIG